MIDCAQTHTLHLESNLAINRIRIEIYQNYTFKFMLVIKLIKITLSDVDTCHKCGHHFSYQCNLLLRGLHILSLK